MVMERTKNVSGHGSFSSGCPPIHIQEGPCEIKTIFISTVGCYLAFPCIDFAKTKPCAKAMVGQLLAPSQL